METPPPPIDSRPFERIAYELTRIANTLVKLEDSLNPSNRSKRNAEALNEVFGEVFHSEPDPDTVDGTVVRKDVKTIGFL
jgi:hypothetical protein